VSRPPRAKLLLIVLALGIVVGATHALWLPRLGYGLIHDDGPAKADMAVVLAGDHYGHRIEKGAELVQAGYVPAVLVSGPPDYGVPECDLAIAMMVRKGYPAAWFIALPNESLSTGDEARVVLGELQRRGVHSFVLITSTFHTARAARTFRAAERGMGVGPRFRTVAARDQYFDPDSWWRNREAQKTVLLEWTKTVASAFGK